jgi:predicted dehydrogenase
MEKIRWGIIGCGDVTEKKSGPAFNKVKGSELVAVMRRDASKAKDYAERHRVPKWYDNASNLIHDPEVNVVYIATPPLSHVEYTIEALKAGKPVYVEKPMAANYAGCLMMNKAVEETGVPLFVAYYRRSLPYFLKVKEIVDQKLLGNIHTVDVKFIVPPREEDYRKNNHPWRLDSKISGGGYFYDMACHQLDLLDYFFGPIAEVYGIFSNRRKLYEAEDTVAVSMNWDNGIIGTGLWDFVADKSSYTDSMIITGDYGTLSFSAFSFSPIRLKVKGEINEFMPENPENIQYHHIRNIVEELQGFGKCPGNIISWARTNKMMDLILQKI